ncbi:17734_t:CDS:2, partial [Cetraspora pellucida]
IQEVVHNYISNVHIPIDSPRGFYLRSVNLPLIFTPLALIAAVKLTSFYWLKGLARIRFKPTKIPVCLSHWACSLMGKLQLVKLEDVGSRPTKPVK